MKAFLLSTFCEADGKGSFSRVATMLLLLVELAWVTHLVWHNHTLPDFEGLALFIGTIYGINTIGQTARHLKSATPPATPTPEDAP